MIPKRFQEISFEDIQSLFDDKIGENKTLEYKSELPNNADSLKTPFLTEVCAFANTEGGDIVFGISDEKGIPNDLVGLKIDNPDQEILRLENSIRTGIEPRVQYISSKLVCGHGKNFILLRVGKSWNAPHKVISNEKFYKRNSAGKYPMDVSELRIAFIQSEQVVDKIRNFKNSRIEKLKSNDELPVQLCSGAKLVLHLLPLSAFTESTYLSFDKDNRIIFSSLVPLGRSGWNHKYNLDGFMTYSGNEDAACSYSYTQLFRNGIIEATSSLGFLSDEKNKILSPAYEQDFIKGTRAYLKIFNKLEIKPPIYFFISFLGIKEYVFNIGPNYRSSKRKSDRDNLILPEGIITNLDEEPHKFFQPFFDMIWNAYGYRKSLNYDEEGNWIDQ